MSKIKLQNPDARLPEMRKRLIISLALNGLLPVVIYALVRPLAGSDVTALTLAAALPVARTLIVWVLRRRLDSIGLLAALGFAIALAVSAFLGGNAIVLELHEQLLLGIVGLVLLASALLGKPLLQSLMQAFTGSAFERPDDPSVHKRFSALTWLTGAALLLDAMAHVILALNLPTATYLAASRLANWAILGGAIAVAWLSRRTSHPQGNGAIE